MIWYFYLGSALIAAGTLNALFGSERLADWTTPACWWGYILVLDSIIHRLRGKSVVRNRPRLFFFQAFFSVIFWCFFEVNNLHMRNWRYVGLPSSPLETALGMGLSFAAILPGLFYTAEILAIAGIFRLIRLPQLTVTAPFSYFLILLGMVCLVFPMMLSPQLAAYLFILIWLGWIFLLEPINYYSGTQSILRDLARGEGERIAALFASGMICGLLWELWNFWAGSKWVYLAPFSPAVKIFEMPLVGFLGFFPFALECFAAYHTARLIFGRNLTGAASLGYRIFD